MELVCHYPDVECEGLRRALAQAEGGSYGVYHLRKRSGGPDLRPGPGVKTLQRPFFPAPTFAEYEQALTACGCETEYIFSLKKKDSVRERNSGSYRKEYGYGVFLQPNNPTGVAAEPEYLKKLAQRCRDIGTFLVLDECFEDFLEEAEKYSMKGYLEEYPQMFLLKAFTKKYAMAGIRLGIRVLRRPQILGKMKEVMQPWKFL